MVSGQEVGEERELGLYNDYGQIEGRRFVCYERSRKTGLFRDNGVYQARHVRRHQCSTPFVSDLDSDFEGRVPKRRSIHSCMTGLAAGSPMCFRPW